MYLHLRFRNQGKRKYGYPEKRGKLNNRKSIHDRPKIIEERSRFGDLEIDRIEPYRVCRRLFYLS